MNIRAKASEASKTFTRNIFAWLRQVKNDHGLPPSAALLALQLTEHFNRRLGGAAWASCEHLATSIGMSKATVVGLLHMFEHRGHLNVEWGKQGRGHSNRYWMIVKGQSADLFQTRKGQIKGQSVARKGQPTDLNHLRTHLKASPKGEAIKKRERER
jgi:hypothetical protein